MDKVLTPPSQPSKRHQTGSPTVPSAPSLAFHPSVTVGAPVHSYGGSNNNNKPLSASNTTNNNALGRTSKVTSSAIKAHHSQGGKLASTTPIVTSPEESLSTSTGLLSPNTAEGITSEKVWLDAKDEVEYVPEMIRQWIMDTWDDIGYHTERPQHLRLSRHELFGAASVAPPEGWSSTYGRLHRAPKIMKERKLDNQVRGVLSRVTPQNFDTCCKDLLNLPIRQSDEEDIKDVVKVFFDKAVSPADRIYAKEYAALFNAMLNKISEEEKSKGEKVENDTTLVSKRIRRELLGHIQRRFENMDITEDITALSNSDGDAEYQEAKRSELVKGRSANINFLGHLFINSLVHEGVVSNVLNNLIGAESETKRIVQDYEFDQFFALLTAVGPYIGEGNKIKRFLPTFIELLRNLEVYHPMKRIQFKAMDLRELIERNFKKKDSMYSDDGPMTIAELNKKQAENELKKTQTQTRNIQNTQTQGGNMYTNNTEGVRPMKVMKSHGCLYGKHQDSFKGSPPGIQLTHNNTPYGSTSPIDGRGNHISPPPPENRTVTAKQRSESQMMKLMESLIKKVPFEDNNFSELKECFVICKGSAPVDAAEAPPPSGTMAVSHLIQRGTRSIPVSSMLCSETIGHSVTATKPTGDRVTKVIAEYLSQFLSSAEEEVPERKYFGLFFKTLLKLNIIKRYQVNMIFTQFAIKYIENRKKCYITNLVNVIESGWPTLGPDLYNIVLNELIERRMSYKIILRFIKMAETQFEEDKYYVKTTATEEYITPGETDPLYVFPFRRFRTIPFVIRYGLLSQNSDDSEIIDVYDEENDEEYDDEDGDDIQNEIDIIDKCNYDNVELLQFHHLVSETEVVVEDGCPLEVVSHYVPVENGKSNSKNDRTNHTKKFISIPMEKMRNIDYLRVMCAIFTFSRFDRDVMTSLMKSMLVLIRAKKALIVPLVLDIYATWRDLHRIPKQAIGEFICIIFSEKLIAQGSFDNIIADIRRECPDDAQSIKMCMKRHGLENK